MFAIHLKTVLDAFRRNRLAFRPDAEDDALEDRVALSTATASAAAELRAAHAAQVRLEQQLARQERLAERQLARQQQQLDRQERLAARRLAREQAAPGGVASAASLGLGRTFNGPTAAAVGGSAGGSASAQGTGQAGASNAALIAVALGGGGNSLNALNNFNTATGTAGILPLDPRFNTALGTAATLTSLNNVVGGNNPFAFVTSGRGFNPFPTTTTTVSGLGLTNGLNGNLTFNPLTGMLGTATAPFGAGNGVGTNVGNTSVNLAGPINTIGNASTLAATSNGGFLTGLSLTGAPTIAVTTGAFTGLPGSVPLSTGTTTTNPGNPAVANTTLGNQFGLLTGLNTATLNNSGLFGATLGTLNNGASSSLLTDPFGFTNAIPIGTGSLLALNGALGGASGFGGLAAGPLNGTTAFATGTGVGLGMGAGTGLGVGLGTVTNPFGSAGLTGTTPTGLDPVVGLPTFF